MKGSKFFSLLVIGDKPEDMLEPYSTKKVNPYIKYKFNDAGKLKKEAIKLIEKMLDSKEKAQLSDTVIEYLKERKKILESLSDFEYYSTITEGMEFDEDGNAISYDNPNAKFKSCDIGKNFALPLKLIGDEKEIFQAAQGEIDWTYLNTYKEKLYTLAWKLFHNEVEPQNEEEKQIQKNMSSQGNYFSKFDSMEQYVTYSSRYWTYAVLDEKGWHDMEGEDTYKWISNYYERFINKLKPDVQLTVYECTRVE